MRARSEGHRGRDRGAPVPATRADPERTRRAPGRPALALLLSLLAMGAAAAPLPAMAVDEHADGAPSAGASPVSPGTVSEASAARSPAVAPAGPATPEPDASPDPEASPGPEATPQPEASPDEPPSTRPRPDDRERRRSYIVTLAVPEAAAALDVGRGGQRVAAVARARRSDRATDALERAYGFRAEKRYRWALQGFSAKLTPAQAARLSRDPGVAGVRVPRPVELAAQTVPTGVRRVVAAPSSAPSGGDVDVDVAVVDTGIGPVGGDELNVQGGTNCSSDGKGPDAWQDLYPSRHGTHVAGIIGARDNDTGVVGVAPGARLWSLRIFTASGFGDEDTVICALEWAVRTHSPDPPRGSQPIEVINMSLVGPRDMSGSEACGPGDPDPQHVAICSAVAAGITVVVAAGNAASDVKGWAPAGYDQVITVAAISDFDGLPGGMARPTCGSTAFGTERDDTYARYSNVGRDVDLVAPGTCITSTTTDEPGSPPGSLTRRLTGTSMATPHVTGAVARYLALHPGTPPATVLERLRTSGSLDWDASTDPDWGGPSAQRGPDRILDVRSLVAGRPDLAVWLLPGRLVPRASASEAEARLELQRIGEADAAVNLAATGLPAEVGSARWPAGAVLHRDGRGALVTGTRLVIDLAPGAPDGIVPLEVEAATDDLLGSRSLDLLVDRTAPQLGGPELRLRPDRPLLSRGRAQVRATWSATDALSGTRRSVLQRGLAGGAWRALATSGQDGRADITLPLDERVRLRLTGTDAAGNRGTRLVRRSISTLDPAGFERQGRWTERTSPGALERDLLATARRGSRLLTSVEGRSVAIVAPIGPARGRLRVRLDGGAWDEVSLRGRTADRWVAWARTLGPGVHTIEVKVVATPAAVDAVLLLD